MRPRYVAVDVSRVKTSARRITDDCLRACVLKRIDEMVFQCGTTPAAEMACKERPKAVASATLGESCENPAATAYWCNRASKLNESCVTGALVLEAAHNCGWNHGGGKGVPGNKGLLLTTDCSNLASSLVPHPRWVHEGPSLRHLRDRDVVRERIPERKS